MNTPMKVRPYQLACLICRAGRGERKDDPIGEIGRLIREDPDRPLTLVANIGDAYAWQDPGHAEDTPEGADFNRKRDLDMLHRLDLAPGATLPARVLVKRLMMRMPTARGVCGYERVTGPAWRGCANAFSGDYERGVADDGASLVPPRAKEEMRAEKECSIAALERAHTVRIRPHILLCAICQYANGVRPPFAEDNLPEFLGMVLQGREFKVELVPQADWDMCAPCPSRVPGTNGCVTGRLQCAATYNEMKDLEVLQALGLTYGTVMAARAIFKLILERIPEARGSCALTKVDVPEYSVWRDACSTAAGPTGYDRGRAMLWQEFGCEGTP